MMATLMPYYGNINMTIKMSYKLPFQPQQMNCLFDQGDNSNKHSANPCKCNVQTPFLPIRTSRWVRKSILQFSIC